MFINYEINRYDIFKEGNGTKNKNQLNNFERKMLLGMDITKMFMNLSKIQIKQVICIKWKK